MYTCEIERIDKAMYLPAEWETEAPLYFQRRDFLQHTDLFNPCNQRYYMMWKKNELTAGACVYTLPVHLFTFSNIPSKVYMQVIGLPASVSAPGIFGRTKADTETLIHYILTREKGLILGLNLPPHLQLQQAIEMNMMPTVVMQQNFDSWNGYLSSLRSPYRRRANHILNAFKEADEERTGCNTFTEKHYSLYLQVMQHTKSKLETLSFDFFKHLPHQFYLTSYYHETELLCWHINCRDEEQLFFFFGGHDYQLLNNYHSYFNNLFGILKEAIEDGFSQIDFGQTAETAKMKTGGLMAEKRMFLYHRNFLIRAILKLCKPLITYKSPQEILHPLKPADVFIHRKTELV